MIETPPPYKPKPPLYKGRVVLDWRNLWLKFGGGIFIFHAQIGRLSMTWDRKRWKV